MKILRYEKKKNGMYQVFFDNGNNIDVHEEIILKYNLLIKKEVYNEEIDRMLDENKVYIAYDLALKYISIKLRSKKEIREYLSKKEIDQKVIDEVILLLDKNNYLDDFMYASAYVNDKILLSNDGPFKIAANLVELGIRDDAIAKALSIFDTPLQKERISKLVNKYKSTNRNKSIFSLKNKILTNLYNLGYDKSIINEVISSSNFGDDSEIAKKEYEKIYKKLSRKYSGSELEYRIKQKMYSLGFNNYN